MNDKPTGTVVTRFAPSPTGVLHMGGLRTALFSYLYAKQNAGKFVLRIEDTDKARNKQEWTDGLIDDLAWLGLTHDEKFIQSERAPIHKKYLEKLIADGFAYISKEEVKEEGQRDEVIRFKNPGKKVTFTDLIRGEMEVDTTDLGNFVIARSIDEPVYHLAVVIDDFEMGITHVIRAEEHLSNTPRQILIQEAIGATRPVYAHLPLVLAPDRTKLSKRKHADISSLTFFREKGYLPEALINFVALLGWNPGTDQEILSMQELIEKFDLSKVQKGGAIFNIDKLNWLNKEYIKRMGVSEQKTGILPFVPEQFQTPVLDTILSLIVDRINTFGDTNNIFETGELDFFFKKPEYTKEKLLWKDEPSFEKTAERLLHVSSLLEAGETDWALAETIKSRVWDYATEQGRGFVLWPMRYALSGKDKSPDPFTLAAVLGKTETLIRIKEAIDTLRK
ncbi:MAG: glutamate--tRNA ligase family protein [Candidatus Paceibacterota bacterium]|jgi:glutamyl-tRNA synthetase